MAAVAVSAAAVPPDEITGDQDRRAQEDGVPSAHQLDTVCAGPVPLGTALSRR